MQPLPHRYDVTVTSSKTSPAEITSAGLSAIESEPPREFDGSGNFWSPETLMVGAVADCLVLTFKAMANASKLEWTTLVCNGKGTVGRPDGVTRFTAIHLQVRLLLATGADREKAQRLLEKAEKNCLVGNSLKVQPVLETEVTFEEEPVLTPAA